LHSENPKNKFTLLIADHEQGDVQIWSSGIGLELAAFGWRPGIELPSNA